MLDGFPRKTGHNLLHFLFPGADLRRRNVSSFVTEDSGGGSSDFEGLMRAQHEAQEQTAEEMLELTRKV